MVRDVVEAVRKCLKSGGFATREKEAEAVGTFLVGFKGRLFEIADDYQVGESVSNFAACGCGHELALGSFFSTPKMKAVDRVRLALEAAEAFSAGVRYPFRSEGRRVGKECIGPWRYQGWP